MFRPLLLLALICAATVLANSSHRHRHRRHKHELHDWLNEEQKASLKDLDPHSAEFKEKVMKYYALLPSDKTNHWNKFYKDLCFEWTKKVTSKEEQAELQSLIKSKDVAKIEETINELKKELGEAERNDVEMWQKGCLELVKATRKRRDIDSHFVDFAKWMSDSQKKELEELKSSGKSFGDIRTKTLAFFEELPADKQKELKSEFKEKCKAYFKPLFKEDESEKLRSLLSAGDKTGAQAVIKGVVERQEGEAKTIASKMQTLCTDVYADSKRRRRETPAHLVEFVKWMSDAQKKELEDLKSSGKSFEDIRTKTLAFFEELPADKQKELRSEFKEKCKAYFKPLFNEDESEKLRSLLSAGDKTGAHAVVTGVVERQEGETKTVAAKMQTVCNDVFTDSKRRRRDTPAHLVDFVKWMTEEQKIKVADLKKEGKSFEEIRVETVKFFEALPADKQKELKEEFQGKCKVYFKPLLKDDEVEKLKSLIAAGDKASANTIMTGVIDRQEGETKNVAAQMQTLCNDVFDSSRKRREISSHFKDFAKWMTDEQKAKLGELRKEGKSFTDIRAETVKFFEELPADKQKELKEEFKDKCRAYFKPLLSEDESKKITSLVESGDKAPIAGIIKAVVERQEGETKAVASEMSALCADIFKETKGKRDVKEKIEKHLAWLTDEQKAVIEEMSNRNEDKAEIRKKLFEFVSIHEKDPTQKDKTVKKCYEWMDEVATKEEIESLHKLHHVDHGACKAKVRELISRLSAEKQKGVNSALPFCEKLWYGDHADHAEHSAGGHEHHGHHHRKRRHLKVIEKYVDWLTESQLENLKKLDSDGTDFDVVVDKLRDYFKQLPADKQDELKTNFKAQCATWAKEVAKPAEWEEIKKLHSEHNHNELKDKLIELEGRLTENQKHTIEHVRGICYKLWDVKEVSRLRRVVNTSHPIRAKRETMFEKTYESNQV